MWTLAHDGTSLQLRPIQPASHTQMLFEHVLCGGHVPQDPTAPRAHT